MAAQVASSPSRCRRPSATRSSSATVSARHSTTSDDRDLVLALRGFGIAKREHAGVDEQSAVAIFGKAREAVDIGHADAGRLQRLDQGIGQPLRKLVQRHQTAGRIRRRQRRMFPAIAERDRRRASAATARSVRVVAAVRSESSGREAAGRSASVASRSNRPPGRGVSWLPKTSGFAGNQRAEAAQQVDAAVESDQRIDIRDLHAALEVGHGELRKHVGIGPQGIARIGRERAGGEHREAGQPQSLRTADRRSGFRIAVAPRRAGAGIEKDADDGQIEFGPGAGGAIGPAVRSAISAQRSSPFTTKCRQRE